MSRAKVCHGCGTRLDPVFAITGEDRHPLCHDDDPSNDLTHLEALHLLLAAFLGAKVITDETRPPHPSVAGPCAGCGQRIERYGRNGRPLCHDCAAAPITDEGTADR
jgi:hypothetical protein